MSKANGKFLLGSHMSIAGGVFNALIKGKAVGCDTIQMFNKSNNQWRAKPLSEEEIAEFKQKQKELNIAPIVSHNSYLINVASPDKELAKKSAEAMLIELQRCETLGIQVLVMHPGSHVGSGEKEGIKRIAEAINWLHDKTPGYQVQIALETTAGQGSNLGYRFEQLAEIIDHTEQKKRMAVCLDSCHIFAAGYDIRDEKNYHKTMREFDSIIGLERLKAIHLNDSVKDFGSRVDRHAHIGQGKIGKSSFKFLMQDERLRPIPKILETPKDDEGKNDRMNLAILKKLAQG
ncbi:MAG: deoxyribonuclease IV [candidate division Zixibacteria bacterium]|nr:deoxyribonuclease IV [candidate division Zixibacteria bacterium]